MIKLLRDTDRRHVQHDKQDIWSTFCPHSLPGSAPEAFGVLTALDEDRLTPGGFSVPQPREEAEIVTCVYMGALTQQDSTGKSNVVYAGEFQHRTSNRGIRHREANASRSDPVHTVRIGLQPMGGSPGRARQQKHFTAAQRHNVLCLVASPDGRKGSLRILQDAFIYSSVTDPGRHMVHELKPGRSAWLHVIRGEATLRDVVLLGGDGAGVTDEPSVSLTARQGTEILLVDVGPMQGTSVSGVEP